MHTLSVTLKQHTPLIHFQHDQEGATLRASEVKPKLDKYILNRISPTEREAGEHAGWIKRNAQKVFLDYKLRIVAEGFRNISIPTKPVYGRNGVLSTDSIGNKLFTTNNYPKNTMSLIMSNIGGRTESEVFNFSIADKVYITFQFKSEQLRKLIINHLSDFFSRNCFGNRTSKGFGSFDIEQIDGESITTDLLSDSYILSFRMIIGRLLRDNEIGNAYKDIFTIIHKLWKSMKTLTGVQGTASNTVLLKVKPQMIKDAERIPSPIRFKPLVDFYRDGDCFFCDVHISFFFDNEVIKCASGINQIQYFDSILASFKMDIGEGLFDFIENDSFFKIDKGSVSLE